MNKTAIDAPPWFDEFEYAGLTKGTSPEGWPPFVVESPVHMYCEFLNIIESPAIRPEAKNVEVRGQIVRTEIVKSVVRHDGSVDTLKLDPIARLGGATGYVRVARGDELHMVRPRWPEDVDTAFLGTH
jgi:flavin reductase (DIM6/NTAB) family NADH-FMN oxidoreductase RutF